MNRIARRAFVVLLLVLVLIGGLSFFTAEFCTKAGDWVLFSGSPHVYNRGKIANGFVTDRNGTALAAMTGDKAFSSDAQVRKAMLHWLGDREGNVSTPALTEYSLEMTGFNLADGLYRYGNSGYKATLALSSAVQVAAMEALGDRHGTVAVYNYKTGELLCAVSTPTFDPDNVPQITEEDYAFDGIYVNRFTQSTYTPGSVFKLITAAAALETVPDITERTFVCYGEYDYGDDAVTCEGAHYEQTLKEALANSCNCVFAQIVELVGQETLEKYVEKYQLTQPVSFDGITTAQGHFDLTGAGIIEVAWSGIGQYTDLINPCRFLTFIGDVAAGGSGAVPYVVSQIQVGDNVTYQAKTKLDTAKVEKTTAQTLKEYMRNNVETVYGADSFPGLNVCAKSGTAEVGGDRRPNAVFAGFVDDPNYPLAFIAVVENAGYGSTVCVPILSQVLSVCKAELDR